jgi:hypothetical protein
MCFPASATHATVFCGATRNIMRKVISGLFISLDGVIELPDQW